MFCSKCGYDAKDANFCPSCGQAIAGVGQQVSGQPAPVRSSLEEIVLWEGKPQGLMDKAKGSLNTAYYKVTNQRIILSGGLIGHKENEIDIKHIKDIKVKQSLSDKLAKVGDITLLTTDLTEGTVTMSNISDPIRVKEIIRKAMMDYRANMNIVYKEDI